MPEGSDGPGPPDQQMPCGGGPGPPEPVEAVEQLQTVEDRDRLSLPHRALTGTEAWLGPDVAAQVYVMSISRHPKAVEEILDGAVQLAPVRKQLADAGHSHRHPAGAWIFVYEDQYAAVLREAEGLSLKHFHIIVNGEVESLVKEALKGLKSKLNVRCNGMNFLGVFTTRSQSSAGQR